MARVDVHHNQLTLPDELREAVHLAEEDYVEAELVEGGILLKPSPDARRRAAFSRVSKAQAAVRLSPELDALPAEDFEERIAELLAEGELDGHPA